MSTLLLLLTLAVLAIVALAAMLADAREDVAIARDRIAALQEYAANVADAHDYLAARETAYVTIMRERDTHAAAFRDVSAQYAAFMDHHYNCDETIAGLAEDLDAALISAQAASDRAYAATVNMEMAQAAAARWQRVASHLTLADLVGSDRDDK